MADEKKQDLKAGIAANDLPDGAMMQGTFEGADVLLANDGGTFRAFSAKCTHLGAPLAKGLLHGGQVRCPWHHARFSLKTGEAVGAPAFGALGCFDVERQGERVVVTGKAAREPAPKAEPRQIVIVGTGAAGYACAQELVRLGAGEGVTLIGMEAEKPYDRTFCSKQYLSGKAEREKVFLKPQEALDAAGVTLRLGEPVEAIDREAREVVLSGGERLGYDALVLATGGEPKAADFPGAERENVRTLRSLVDADRLIEAADKARRVAVLGASFIGLEAAAALTQRGLSVEVVAPGEVPLSRVLGPELGAMVKVVHEGKGVRFRMGRKATDYDGARLTLDDGSRVEADLVVAGIGVSPRVDLARAAGLDLAEKQDGGGVTVDASLRTSDPAIFAVGDIASYPDVHSGHRQRVEHWVHAGRQGEHAARAILGADAPFSDLPFFWSAHFDVGLRYVGHVSEPGALKVDGSLDEREFAAEITGKDASDRALVTCKRDLEALRTEAEWEDARVS
jgi:apoptosis-inducing factor 3